MIGNGKPDDPIAAAIEATAESQAAAMAQAQVTISSTGRPFAVTFPADMSDSELAEAVGWMLTSLMHSLRAERAKTAGGRIIVPRR
jgi:hypothetical protein